MRRAWSIEAVNRHPTNKAPGARGERAGLGSALRRRKSQIHVNTQSACQGLPSLAAPCTGRRASSPQFVRKLNRRNTIPRQNDQTRNRRSDIVATSGFAQELTLHEVNQAADSGNFSSCAAHVESGCVDPPDFAGFPRTPMVRRAVAEGVRFELTAPLPARRFSRPVH